MLRLRLRLRLILELRLRLRLRLRRRRRLRVPTNGNLTPTPNQGAAVHPLHAFQAAYSAREDLPQRQPARHRDAAGE